MMQVPPFARIAKWMAGIDQRRSVPRFATRTLRRAAAVHPIAALQSEYSLWERDVEEEILPVARTLGIGFVPYSPLGRGFLTGQITSRDQLPEGDYRRNDPRYSVENFARNMATVEVVSERLGRHLDEGAG